MRTTNRHDARRREFALLALVVVLVFSAGRGSTAKQSRGDYSNAIKVTASGVYRFSKTATGAGTASDYQQVKYTDVNNRTTSEVVIVLYRPSNAKPAAATTHYIPAGDKFSWPGIEVDSVAVTGVFGVDQAVYMEGAD